jgi:threonine dehydrogenase-like Zn-dependent dehydrogenase
MNINTSSEQTLVNSQVYVLTAPKVLNLKNEKIDITKLGTNSVFAKTLYTSISTGTEIAAWHGKPPLRPSNAYPRLVGYCNLAVVQAVGSDINDLEEGDYILTHQSHRSSFFCNRQEVLVIAKNINQLSQKRLTTTYLYHLGYAALLSGGYRPGFEVAVIGLGALGFASASLISAYGGTPLILTDRSNVSSILEFIPFSQCITKAEGEATYKTIAGLDGADLVINTSDSWEDYELGLKTVRRGGTIILVGFPGRGLANPRLNPLDSKYIYDKLITISQVAHCSEHDMPSIDLRFTLKRNLAHIYSLLETERIDPAPLLRSKFSWDNLEGAYRFLETRPQDSLSAILDWSC